MKRIHLFCLALALTLGLTACGGDSASASEVSDAAEASVSSVEEASASEEETSAVEDSALEGSAVEEAELTIDEQFSAFLSDASGVCLLLQVYDQNGTPVRHGIVSLSEAAGADEAASQTETAANETETDYSGYAFVSDLELDVEYTLRVYDQNDEPVGTVALLVSSGSEYDGSGSDGTLVLTVADGILSNVDMAIVATDDDGTVSSFSLVRMDLWTGLDETE